MVDEEVHRLLNRLLHTVKSMEPFLKIHAAIAHHVDMILGHTPLQQMVDHQNYMKLPEEACDLCAGDTSDDFLYQYVIPVCSKQQIVRELDMLGINGKTLFPGLDGVGKHIERIYRFDYQKNLGGY